jgi:hypothetical protein
MFKSQMKVLRITAIVVQYELGIAVSMSDPSAIPPIGFSVSNILYALNNVGAVSARHAILGGLLVFASVVNLILSLGSKIQKRANCWDDLLCEYYCSRRGWAAFCPVWISK